MEEINGSKGLAYHGASILTALVAAPLEYGPDFFVEEFQAEGGLYSKYRNNLRRNFVGNSKEECEEFDSVFYQPRGYYLFGRFDLAIISLIDDFEFSSRTFKSYCPIKEESNVNFKFQIITGAAPDLNAKSLVGQAKDTFLRDREARYPLIAITSLKINNALIIGNGVNFLHPVLRGIQYLIDDFKSRNPQIDAIIQESFSWNEFTLLIFSDSYLKITNLILEIREMNFAQLFSYPVNDYDELEATVRKNSLYSVFQDPDSSNFIKEFDNTHIFKITSSIFGYDRDYHGDAFDDREVQQMLMEIQDGEKVRLFSRWVVKPGHLSSVVNRLIPEYKDFPLDEIKLSIGKGDFNFPDLGSGHGLEGYIGVLDKMIRSEQTRTHLSDLHTIPEIDFPIKNLSERRINTNDFSMAKYLKEQQKVAFSIVKHQENLAILRKLGVPKILSERLFSIISNYNDGILDPILYIYYIELRPYILAIINFITDFDNSGLSFTAFCEQLDSMYAKFEVAYQNRYHQNYSLAEQSDHNLDFNGGIQQLLTSFDAAYKIICSALGEGHMPKSFAYITGYPGVSSTYYSLRLNYLHIFQPSTFVASATHEAANFIVDRDKGWYVGFNSDGGTSLKFLRAYLPGAGPEQLDIFTKLRQEIQQNTFFRELEKKEKVFAGNSFDSIAPRFFNYVLTDLITYYFGYNADSELFYRWHWNYFMQVSMHYEKLNRIDLVHFVTYLLRMVVLFRIVDPEFIQKQVFAPNALLQRIWDQLFDSVTTFADCLFTCETSSYFFKNAECLSQSVLVKAYLPSHEAARLLEIIAGEQKTGKKDTLKLTLKGMHDRVTELSERNMEYLKEGVVCTCPANDKKVLFLQSLFYAYLKLIQTDTTYKNSIVRRRFEDGKIDLSALEDRPGDYMVNADYLFDPRGGIFTYKIETRKQYLKYRSALLKSLWDMGMKEKRVTFRDIHFGPENGNGEGE